MAIDARKPASNADVRRLKILDAAARQFDEVGYHNTSMNAIAAASGIRKPTLYHYFTSKTEILLGVHDVLIDHMLEMHQEVADSSDLTPSQKIYEIIRDILSLQITHRGYVKAYVENTGELTTEMRRDVNRRRRRYQDLLRQVLQSGIDGGQFRETNAELTAIAIFGMVNWGYQWYGRGDYLPLETVATHFHDLVMSGLSPR